jgi:hypothetical protein
VFARARSFLLLHSCLDIEKARLPTSDAGWNRCQPKFLCVLSFSAALKFASLAVREPGELVLKQCKAFARRETGKAGLKGGLRLLRVNNAYGYDTIPCVTRAEQRIPGDQSCAARGRAAEESTSSATLAAATDSFTSCTRTICAP